MGILDSLLGAFGGSSQCGDRETLIQPGGWVDVRCTRDPGHAGNHYDSHHTLEWGDEPLHDYKDRPAHFG